MQLIYIFIFLLFNIIYTQENIIEEIQNQQQARKKKNKLSSVKIKNIEEKAVKVIITLLLTIGIIVTLTIIILINFYIKQKSYEKKLNFALDSESKSNNKIIVNYSIQDFLRQVAERYL